MPDTTSADEIDAIHEMLKHGEREGLAAEVVWTFASICRGQAPGLNIPQACTEALAEWDI